MELKAASSFDITHFLQNEWVVKKELLDRSLLENLKNDLDPGEAEAIALATEMNTGVLMDERKGRQMALDLGLKVTGTVGVLLIAKELGLISEVKPLLHDLEHKAGFWMSNSFKKYALHLAGEEV